MLTHFSKIFLAAVLSCCSCFVLARAAESKPGNVQKPSVVKLFRDAQQLYKSEHYPQARAAFDRILRLYPTHEPSLILYARTQYKLNNLPEAYKAFGKVKLAALDPDTSYEYGQTYYQGNQFDGALAAFKRIPDGHALADLANYYGAICAAKLHRYQESEDMLEKALVLPDKLAKSRAQYLKHVQEMRLLQEKQGLQKERNDEKKRLAEQQRLANKDPQKNANPADKKDVPKTDAPYEHKGTQLVTRAGRIDYENKRQTENFHGYGEKNATIDVASFTFYHGPLFPLPLIIEDRQAAVGLQLMLKGEDRKTDGEEHRFVSESSQSDLIRILNKSVEEHTKQGEVELTPWLEFPLPLKHWLAFVGDLDLVFPDYEKTGRTGSRGGKVLGSGTRDILTYTLSGAFTQFFDDQTQPGSTLSRVKGELLFTWPQGTSLWMEARHDEFDYVDPTLDGPDASTLAKLTASQVFPMGFTLSLAGTYELQENNFFHTIPERPLVGANGTVFTGKAELIFTPFTWLSLGVSQLLSQTNWNVKDPDDVEIFERNVPNFSSELSATAALIMTL